MAGGWEHVASELVETRYSALVGFAATLTGSRSAAEDLVQDALLAAFGKRRRLENAVVAESYVRRAIATKYVDSTRRAIRDRSLAQRLASEPEELAAAADAGVGSVEGVEAALARLSPQERACVVLRHLEQYSTRETAEALGLSDGAVKRYVHDGVRKLATELSIDLHAQEPEWTDVAHHEEARHGR